MNKRITSLLLCFVMVFAMMATAVPALAAPITSTQIKVIPDKTTASPGDIITYSIVLGPVSDMGSMQMVLDIPTGLTYVTGSGKLEDNLRTNLGYDAADWTEVSLMVNGYASAADYESDTDTTLAKFQCKVTDGATGNLEVGLDELEFYSCQTFEDHTERFSVVKTAVTISGDPGSKVDPTITTPPTATVTYGDAVDNADLTGGAASVPGEFQWMDSVTSYGDATNGTPRTLQAKFVPDDTSQYNTVENIAVKVTVNAKNITDVTVAGIPDQPYTGSPITPSVTVKGDSGKTLVLDQDYTVEYGPNNSVGTDAGSVTVKAKTGGNYTFTEVTKNFNIVAQAGTITISGDLSKTYDGTAVNTSSLSVDKNGSSGIVTYKFYTDAACTEGATTTAPTNAGTYYVKAFMASDGSHAAAESNVLSFTISPKDIAGADITLASDSLPYNGTEQTVSITSVLLDETPLNSGDYDIQSGGRATDAHDSITLTIRGKNNYSGTASKIWKITKIDPASADFVVSPDLAAAVTYDGSAKTVAVTPKSGVTGMGAVTVKYNGSTAAPTGVDSYSVTVDVAEGTNYNAKSGIAVGTLTIQKAPAPTLSAISVSHKYTLTGEKAVDLGGLVAGATDYTLGALAGDIGIVTGSAVNSSGRLTYTLTGTGAAGNTVTLPVTITSTNYEDAIVNVVVTLTDKETPTATANNITVTYNGASLPASAITGTASVDGTWRWKSTPPKTVADSGPHTVVFTPSDTVAYETVEDTITVTIQKAATTGKPKYTAISSSGKTLANANLTATGSNLTPNAGTLEWVDDAGTPLPGSTPVVANKTYKWRFTPTDPNYTSLTGSVKLYVYSGGTGGGGGGGSSDPTYGITVEQAKHGTITVSPKYASKGDTVTITVKPDKDYELDTLKILDKDGDKVKITEKNGKYTFTMPASKVTVTASFAPEAPEQIFTDVPADAYYFEAVKWAAEQGITGGTSSNRFSPSQACSRAQIVTFLWRAAGSPAPKKLSSFADVPADAYYAQAVAWAVENGITGGTGNGMFSPDAACTRAQCVTFLYRAAGSPAVSGSPAFSDVASDAYYAAAVKWAEANGITGGIGSGLFGSGSHCTRAQIVTFIYRYMTK